MAEPARIRLAATADREALLGLWLDLLAHHRSLDSDYPALPGIREALLRELGRGFSDPACRLWVAEGDGGLVGFLFAEHEAAEEGVGMSWIHELYVEPAARRVGVGRDLVAAARDFFTERRAARISVRVETRNGAGLRFWHALGFDEKALILERREG